MEITRTSYPGLLLDILDVISTSNFVAFDLELSGVASKQRGGGQEKPKLQQRYEETKRAAEVFQILQVGITCVEEVKHRGKYVARPYNFNLCPIAEKELGIERNFMFQSDAAYFLLEHGFNFHAPFKEGVPYLSRSEAALARKAGLDRLDRSMIADIQLGVEDVQALAFVDRVREEIDTWLKEDKVKAALFLNVAPLGHDMSDPLTRPDLSKFEKRLVHQLVRAEYPSLRTFSKRAFIQIIPLDQEREDIVKIQNIRRMEQRITRETGFRWVVEALVGGDLSNIDPRSFAFSPLGEHLAVDIADITRRFQAVQARLSNRRTVLVGHNLFTDLVCLYRSFIGELPEQVEDFQRILHGLFPLIVDTKYMATHNCGDINPASSLAETEVQLRDEQSTVIELPSDFCKYLNSSAYHEAGYDSYLTARICTLLSAKLSRTATSANSKLPSSVSSEGEQYDTAREEMETTSASSSEPAGTTAGVKINPLASNRIAATNLTDTPRKSPLRAKRERTKLRGDADTFRTSKFSHTTLFDQLRVLDLQANDASDHEPDRTSEETANGGVSLAVRKPKPVSKRKDSASPKGSVSARLRREDMMPPYESDFWHVYGNRLRVFGTTEGVCNLAGSVD